MPEMAGCGTCPDQCSCVIVDQCNDQFSGAGTADNPIVIPRRYDYPFVPTSDDGSIEFVPGDVRNAGDCSDADGHAPDLSVNFCALVEPDDVNDGDVLVVRDEDDNCRPHRLRDPAPGEVLSRDPVTGRAAWLGGVASFGGDVPYGVPLEFWGGEATVPAGYGLADYGLLDIADNPNLFGVIGHNASGGVDPGGGQFHKPDKRGVVAAGRDNMGGTPANRVTDPLADTLGSVLGVEASALVTANLPPHTHPLTINAASTGVSVVAAPSAVSIAASGTGISIVGSSTGISIPSSGAHNHDGAGANHDFLVENSAPAAFVYLAKAGPNNVDVANSMRFTSNGLEGGLSNKPNREPLASASSSAHSHSVSDPGHGHGVTDPTHSHTVTNGNHGHSISDPGHVHTGTAAANAAHTSTPVNRLQPTVFVNYILRIG